MVSLRKKGHLHSRGAALWMNIEKWIKMPPEADCSIHRDSLPRSYKNRLAAHVQLLQSADCLHLPHLLGYPSTAENCLVLGKPGTEAGWDISAFCRTHWWAILSAEYPVKLVITLTALHYSETYPLSNRVLPTFPSQASTPNKHFVPQTASHCEHLENSTCNTRLILFFIFRQLILTAFLMCKSCWENNKNKPWKNCLSDSFPLCSTYNILFATSSKLPGSNHSQLSPKLSHQSCLEYCISS